VQGLDLEYKILMEMKCFLCDSTGAMKESADHGNRQRIACVSPGCGSYVITSRAIRRLEEGGPNREVLVEMVRLANERANMLTISVASDGLLETTEILPAA
jgi:hypothetical protein